MDNITVTIGKHETTITREEAEKLSRELKSKLAEPAERVIDNTGRRHALFGDRMRGEPEEVQTK